MGSTTRQDLGYDRAEEHARAWVALQSDLLRAPNTISSYSRGLDHFLLFCHRSGIDPVGIGRGTIASYIRELSGRVAKPTGDIKVTSVPLANASIRHRLTIVRLFFQYLVEEGVRALQPFLERPPWLPLGRIWSKRAGTGSGGAATTLGPNG